MHGNTLTIAKSILVPLVFGAMLAGGAASLGAQTVAEDVLRNSDIEGVTFRNYEGPHRVIESRLAIQGIGADLGRRMQAPGATEADYAGKYHVVRVHDATSDKLSADVFILGPDAGVDHIRNLNWIVSAYLQQAFGYSVTDADLLASFVTRYNAWYRGKMSYVASTFIPAVGAAVTADNVGLALTWSEWPGKTKMLIPLRDSLSKGLAGGVNTEEISNKDVVTKMAEEPGKGLDDRKKLADLKEGEIVQEQKAVAQAEAAAVPAAVPAAAGTTTPATPATPGVPGAPGATTTPAAATPATPGVTAPPGATPAAALPLAEAKKQLAARDEALQTERKDIVKQESKEPVAPAVAPPAKPAVTAAIVKMNEGSKTGQLWLVDPATNKVWKKSDLNTIRQNKAPAFGAGLLVVAGDTKGNGAIRLVIVSKDDATVLVTGANDVPAETTVLVQGNQAWALTQGSAGWVLGVFDANLKLAAQGTDALSPLSAIVPTANGVLVQGANGALLLLDDKTLKKKSATEG